MSDSAHFSSLLVQPQGQFASLDHSRIIRVAGGDAANFLHGQLTHDFASLGLSEARLAAYCSPKGRMLASFVGFKRAHDEIWLVCRADVQAATIKRLRMFVLRAKATLDESPADTALLGLAGAGAWLESQGVPAAMPTWSQARVGEASVIRLPDAAGTTRWLWAGPAVTAPAPMTALASMPLATWDWLDVHSGIAPITAATAEAFVPQMLNYELVGGVNFQKGCYPGQEIVARSQYRGTVKRRAALLHSDEPMQAGDEVFWSEDPSQPSGMVALAAEVPTLAGAHGGRAGHDALVEIKLAALDAGSLHLRSTDGPSLERRALPYVIPREASAA